jgi:hypothetical protein
MAESSLPSKAYVLREEGNFRAAHEAFSEIAGRTDDALEKANIILTGLTALVPVGGNAFARKESEIARELLAHSTKGNDGGLRHEEFLRVTIGIELEEASLASAKGEKLRRCTSTLR